MEKTIISFEKFLLNSQTRQLHRQNEIVEISSKGFDVLFYLIQKRGELATKDEIYQAVWGDTFVEENNIHVQISALRRVLGEKRGESKFIKTVPGKGYIFIAPVEKLAHNKVAKSASNSYSLNNYQDSVTSIAVLPFSFEPPDDEFDYLTNGITQNLIEQLSGVPGFKVMAFSAVKNYKNSQLNPAEIGFQLGVNKILQGTVSKINQKLEINIELINAADSTYIWGTNYQCSTTDFVSARTKISLEIAENLKPNLNSVEKKNLAKAFTKNEEAFQSFQKGKHILENFASSNNRQKSLKAAAKFFQEAIKLDKNFAIAYICLGRTYFFLAYNSFMDKSEALFQIQMLLQSAFNLHTDLSEGYELRGMVRMIFDFDFKSAEISLKKANEINPNNAYSLHILSLQQCILQKFDESITTQNRAIQLDPSSISYNVGLANRFYFAGEFEKAIIQANEVLDLESNSAPAYLIKSLALAQLGNFRESFENIEFAVSLYPVSEYKLSKCYVLALMGKKSEAKRLLSEHLQTEPKDKISFGTIPPIYIALGEPEKALDWIEKNLKTKILYSFFFPFDPAFQSLRNHPRFIEIVKTEILPHFQ